MPVLVVLIIVSFSMYVFYKVRSFMAKGPAEKYWINAKARMALGAFVGIFGINQLFLNPSGSAVVYIVAAIFVIVGVFSIYIGIKSYKHHLPHAAEEVATYKK